MCFNVVALNPRRGGLGFLVDVADWQARYNGNGYSLWAHSPDAYVRTLDYGEFKAALRGVLSAKIVHYHLRLASSGDISIENVHMWKVGDYYVSHNGFVSAYRGGLGDGPSDTYQLVMSDEFREAVEARDWEYLGEVLKEVGFYGVMFLTSPESVVAVSLHKTVKVHDFGDVLVLSNKRLRKKYYRKWGFRFSRTPPSTSLMNAIAEVDPRTMMVVRVRRIEVDNPGYFINY